MSEQVVDRVVRHLGVAAPACRTAVEPLLRPEDTAPFSGIEPAPFSREAVEHYVGREWARHRGDVFLRRSGWHYARRYSPDAVAQAADRMGACLGWTAGEKAAEIQAFVSRECRPPAG